MKVIKNKKRFDPRWHHSERLESKEQEINEIKVNFNSFNLGTWMDEDVVKEYVLDPSVSRGHEEREVPKTKRKKPTKPTKPASQVNQDKALRDLDNDELLRTDLEEMCGGPEMGPEEEEPAITDLGPDEAFGAGYTAAVEEIMASLEGLLGDPIEMGPAPEEEEIGGTTVVFEDDFSNAYGDDPSALSSEAESAEEVTEEGEEEEQREEAAGALEESESSKMDLAIDQLVNAFQKKQNELTLAQPEIYEAIMSVIKARAAEDLPPPQPGSRDYGERHGDYLE